MRSADLSAEERIAAFESRFGGAHLDVAAHLAFPLSLTTELAYGIWSCFRRDTYGRALALPWIVVPDLLLSSLCREVGFELYEVDLEVREVLLERLVDDARFGVDRLEEVAEFVYSYVGDLLESNDVDEVDFAVVQQLTAVAHTDAGNAARSLLRLLNGANVDDQGEANLLATTVDALSAGRSGPMAAYPPLTAYARALELRTRGDVVAASQTIRSVVGDGHEIEVAGLAVRVPHELIVTSREERERRPPYRRPIKSRRLLVVDTVGSGSADFIGLSAQLRALLAEQEYGIWTPEDVTGDPVQPVRTAIERSTPEDLLLVVVLSSTVTRDRSGLVVRSSQGIVHLSTLIAELRSRSALRSMVVVCASAVVDGLTGESFLTGDGNGDVSTLCVGGQIARGEPLMPLRMLVSAFSGEAVPLGSTVLTSTDLAAYAREKSSGEDALDVLFVPGRQVLTLSEGLSGGMVLDDLDGRRADEEIDFSLDGVQYRIDLSSENAERLREIFSVYIEHARRTR